MNRLKGKQLREYKTKNIRQPLINTAKMQIAATAKQCLKFQEGPIQVYTRQKAETTSPKPQCVQQHGSITQSKGKHTCTHTHGECIHTSLRKVLRKLHQTAATHMQQSTVQMARTHMINTQIVGIIIMEAGGVQKLGLRALQAKGPHNKE
jgi:hypothetical protein